jgi:hypothetical protein
MTLGDGDALSEDGCGLNARLLDKVRVLRPKTLGGDQTRILIA